VTARLALFDCDGTLIDGQAPICEAMEEAFAVQGLTPPDRNAVRRAVGLSLPVAVRLLAPDKTPEVQDIIVLNYKTSFRTARVRGAVSQPLIPGIRDVLDSLREAGWVLGVATGMSDPGLAHCLASHAIADRFATLQTADRHPSKPHPSMAQEALRATATQARQAVMIGDTVFDMEMAKAAGMRGIGVAWGYHEPRELVAAGAEIVARDPAQLAEYLLS
jgi:phosphoglycolate phosphatase